MTSKATNQELQQRKNAATPRGVGVMCDFYAERASNAELWDVEGRRFIDFAAGIAVLNTGHRHPKLLDAMRAQLDKFTHTAYQIVPYASYVELAERINAVTPGNYPKKTAFFSTGAEAVENAIKIARAHTGRPGVIAFAGGFHGRTMMGMALTGKVAPYKLGFGPFPGDVFHAPYPSALHGITTEDALDAVHGLFKSDIEAKRVAAIILEPVQGEGGFYAAPADFMRGLRAICDEHGILLIADEVQSGYGRTGKLFAMEHYDVLPDMMTMAKSLAGGMPLSAVNAGAELMEAPAAGGQGGTRGGDLGGGGDKLQEHLKELRSAVPQIAEVRGVGAMVAVEFADPVTGKPDADYTKKVQQHALNNGLLLLSCGSYGNVIRFLFPLTIPDTVMDEALGILAKAIKLA